MYFKAIPLKQKKPNSGFFRQRIILFNVKTKEVMTFAIGMATDWEYFMKGKGFTHWIKPISKEELKSEISKPFMESDKQKMMEKVIGNCGKHPGYNMVNCPMCAIEEQQYMIKHARKYHAVEYSGYWHIQDGPFYGDRDILNADDVGQEQAAANARRIVNLLNSSLQNPK